MSIFGKINRPATQSAPTMENDGFDEGTGMPIDDTGAPATQEENPEVQGEPEELGGDDDLSQPEIEEGTPTAEGEEGDEDGEDDLDDIIEDGEEVEALNDQLALLEDTHGAVESFGIDPLGFMLLTRMGLMTGTAMESMAIESFAPEQAAGGEAEVALEAIVEKIKETAKAIGEKIVNIAKTGAEKIKSALEGSWEKVKSLVTRAANATWDATKAAGAYVKAHPFQTILTVVGVIIAVAGGLTFFGASFPAAGSKLSVFNSWNAKFAEKMNAASMKWPFGKAGKFIDPATGKRMTVSQLKAAKAGAGSAGVAAKVASMQNKAVAGARRSAKIREIKALPAKALGWASSSFKMLKGQLEKAWAALSTAIGSVFKRGTTAASTATSTASKYSLSAPTLAAKAAGNVTSAAGADAAVTGMGYLSRFTAAITSCWAAVREFVMGGFSKILATLRALNPFMKGAAEAAA